MLRSSFPQTGHDFFKYIQDISAMDHSRFEKFLTESAPITEIGGIKFPKNELFKKYCDKVTGLVSVFEDNKDNLIESLTEIVRASEDTS